MKTRLFITLTVFLFSFGLYAQKTEDNIRKIECETYFDSKDTIHLPHFGQNEVLYRILDITMKKQRSTLRASSVGILADNIPFHIPVKIWVYRNNDGTNPALSVADTQDLFNEINRLYAKSNTGIQFYLKCGIEYINSTKFNTIDSNKEFEDMIATYREPYALNWHLVHSTTTAWTGKARFPWDSNNFSFAIGYWGGLIPDDIITTAHEIGHTLGLLHTHENTRGSGIYNGDASNCYQESVSRTRTQGVGCISTIGQRKCEINGDALCDTEAAPNSTHDTHIRINNLCDYVGSGTDNWGDAWNPPTRNYMSYVWNYTSWNFGLCGSEFTQGQIGVMHSCIMLYMADVISYIPLKLKPWYNLHSISLSGTVNFGENETFIVPQNIEVAPGTNTYTVNSGATVKLQAGESIVLKPGFHAKAGSVFSAKAEPLSGCSTIQPFVMEQRDGSYSLPVGSLSQDDIDECVLILTKALNRGYYKDISDFIENDEAHENESNHFSFTFYPNPTSGYVSIEYKLHVDALICIELCNIFGQNVKLLLPKQKQKSGNYSIQTSFSDLGTGTYFVKISSGNQVESKQVIIQ